MLVVILIIQTAFEFHSFKSDYFFLDIIIPTMAAPLSARVINPADTAIVCCWCCCSLVFSLYLEVMALWRFLTCDESGSSRYNISQYFLFIKVKRLLFIVIFVDRNNKISPTLLAHILQENSKQWINNTMILLHKSLLI